MTVQLVSRPTVATRAKLRASGSGGGVVLPGPAGTIVAPSGPLPFQPPSMSNYAGTKIVTDANRTLTTASMWTDDGDYIIDLGGGSPITAPYVNINFQGKARNVIIRGGEMNVALAFGAAPTGKGLYSNWPARRITSTATGGTFRMKRGEASYWPYGTPLPYNATAAQVQAGIEALIGTGHAYVTGGPLTVAPIDVWPATFDPELGRLISGSGRALDTSGITGGTMSSADLGAWPNDVGVLRIDNWKGELFIEGVWLHGPGLGEGINANSTVTGATLTMQNCHFAPEFYRYHNDYQHPDGGQFYAGPTHMKMARSDLWSPVQGLMLQSTALADFQMRDSYMRGGFNAAAPTRKGEFGIYCVGLADRLQIGSNVYAYSDGPSDLGTTDAHRRTQFLNDTNDPTSLKYPWFPHYNAGANQLTGLHPEQPVFTDGTRSMFCDPARGECGIGYVSPGYV